MLKKTILLSGFNKTYIKIQNEIVSKQCCILKFVLNKNSQCASNNKIVIIKSYAKCEHKI